MGCVNSDDDYHAYYGNETMVYNKPEESGEVVMYDVGAMAENSPETLSPATSDVFPSTASAGTFIPGEGTANDLEIVARFLRGISLSAADVIGDVMPMAGALVYRLAGGEAPDSGKG